LGGGRSDNLNEEIANLKKLIKDKKRIRRTSKF
jgi:hypothetical protein